MPEVVIVPPQGKCDFCTVGTPEFEHESLDAGKPVDIVGMQHGQPYDTGWSAASVDNAWAACHECHLLILEGKRESLVRRSARATAVVHPEIANAIAVGEVTWQDVNAEVRRAQAVFWANRTGQYHLVA